MLDVDMKEVDKDFWMTYLDDILTYSGKPWVLFRHLTLAVLPHTAVGIKRQPCKTKLFQSKVEYLGHKISNGGVSMICTEDQRLACVQDGEGSGYVVGILRILQNLHTPVFSTDKPAERDEEGGEVHME